MIPNDSLKDGLKRLEAPHVPQQGINSFFSEVLRKANAATNHAFLSGDLTKRISSMTSAADWSRQLLRSFEPTRSAFQKVIDDAARSEAVYRNLGSLADTVMKAAPSMRTSVDFSNVMLQSIQPPKGSMQGIIAATQKATLKLHVEQMRDQAGAIARLAQLYSRPQVGGLSRLIQQAMVNGQIWESDRIIDFASRVISQPAFRQAVIERLESEVLPAEQAVDANYSSQQVLEAVERGIEESLAIQDADEIQASVNSMFSRWSKLPPDLRSLAITLLSGLLLLVADHAFFGKDQPPSHLPNNQRVKIVQMISNNIFVNAGVSHEQRRQFRIVTRDGLPVFRSNRIDSGRIGALAAARVVTVKRQKRNWTLVEWQDANSQAMQTGWVFTRYLKRI